MYSFLVVDSIKDVPTQWIYYNYLGITQPMDGSTIRHKSFLNSDTTPSLYIYIKNGKYRWKDFSSGHQGSAIDMVMILNPGITYAEACTIIEKDYNNYIRTNGPFRSDKIETSLCDYTLKVDYGLREFEEKDYNFWYGRYGIDEDLLNEYYVLPLASYQLFKEYPNFKKPYNITKHNLMYGYFQRDGSLYAIYQPEYRDLKFIKLYPFIQGLEQLSGTVDTVIIQASMKDLLVTKTMSLDVDLVAPHSETTLLSISEVQMLKKEYKYVFTMLDNDRAGIQSMRRYKEVYDLDFIYISLDKDIADARENHGFNMIRNELIININKNIQLCNSRRMAP